MANEMMVRDGSAMTVNDMKAQVNTIQRIMREVMKNGEHYGVIPGTGDKPSLLKPGAEKIMLTFHLVPDPEVEVIDLLGQSEIPGHREYRVRVRLLTQSGIFLGAGLGSCSTLETKYRFRTGPKKSTGKPVPKEYWDNRQSDAKKAQEAIGGKGFTVMKDDTGQWMIAEQGERVEYDNPADHYNTCEKMAKKRALVDATLTVTAASDIFTQDEEDLKDNGVYEPETGGSSETKHDPVPQKMQDGSMVLEAFVSNVTVSKGTNPKTKQPWTKYMVHVGDLKFQTFSETMATRAKEIMGNGELAKLFYKETQYGNELISVNTPGEGGA